MLQALRIAIALLSFEEFNASLDDLQLDEYASKCQAGCFAKALKSISMLQMYQLADSERLEGCAGAGPPF